MEIFQGTEGFGAVGLGTIRVIRKKTLGKRNNEVDRDEEIRKYESAKKRALNELKAMRSLGNAGAASQLMLLEDHQLSDSIMARILNLGCDAHEAISGAGKHVHNLLSGSEDKYLANKSSEIKMLCKLLLSYLDGYLGTDVVLPDPCIVAADSLSTSDFLKLDQDRMKGLVVEHSSANSHMAIMAKAMGIPTIIGCEINDEWNGKKACVDGGWRVLYLEPDGQTIADMKKRIDEHQRGEEKFKELHGKKCVTRDGREIHLFANITSPRELPTVDDNDAEGVGLYRTEPAFINRSQPPEENELYEEYRTVAMALGNRMYVIRTIDLAPGRDAPYLPFDEYMNSSMGLRGIRLCLKCPELFKKQVRAILRAALFGRICIMLPMIASIEEFNDAKDIIEECYHELSAAGIPCKRVRVGAMVETPAAVMISDELAQAADFLSIGTNDLTQYTLCADRENRDITEFCDYHHPAIMRMIRMTAENAKKHGTLVGICGEMASDERVIPAFIEMGIDAFSVIPVRVLPLRSFICGI